MVVPLVIQVLDEFDGWLAGWHDCPAKRWVEENMPEPEDAASTIVAHMLAA